MRPLNPGPEEKIPSAECTKTVPSPSEEMPEQVCSEEKQVDDFNEQLCQMRAELEQARATIGFLQNELEALGVERDDWRSKTADMQDRFLRAKSDLDGFRKRTQRDFEDRVTRAMSDFVLRLIEVADNFDRSLEAFQGMSTQADRSEGQGPGVESFLKGVAMIREQLLSVLSKEGVKPIPSPVGQTMDPEFHEAVEAREGGGEHGTVLEEMQKGYSYKNLVLRATKVRVIR